MTDTKYSLCFTLIVMLITLVLKDYETFQFVLGILSAAIEALLGVPQFILNFKRKNTSGLS